MSDFKAKMHPIRFRLGLRPRPRWGSLQRSPDPLAAFKGPTSKGRGGRGRKGGKGGEGSNEGKKWREGERKGRGRGEGWEGKFRGGGGEGKGVGERGGREGKFRGARPPKRYFLEPRLGGVLSPTLCYVYIDGLLISLCRARLGCHIGYERNE